MIAEIQVTPSLSIVVLHQEEIVFGFDDFIQDQHQ